MARKKKVKPVVDGITFDSTGEANCYKHLKANKEIDIIGMQESFVIQKPLKYIDVLGKQRTMRAIGYTPDFTILYKGEKIYLEYHPWCRPVDSLRYKYFRQFITDRGDGYNFIVIESMKHLREVFPIKIDKPKYINSSKAKRKK